MDERNRIAIHDEDLPIEAAVRWDDGGGGSGGTDIRRRSHHRHHNGCCVTEKERELLFYHTKAEEGTTDADMALRKGLH